MNKRFSWTRRSGELRLEGRARVRRVANNPVILTAASSLYGAVTEWRSQWYAQGPSRQRRLSRPVISVGNLRAGGAGKTPVVAAIARMLASRGHRPAILIRGYARRMAPDGVTVVSDGKQVLAPLATAGDEALMLARALNGVAVLAGADRYLSGCLAEVRFGATAHLLDDGFQHVSLARDVDLLIVDGEDLSDRLLPAGRLREPLSAAARADALLTAEADPMVVERLRNTLAVEQVFRVSRTLGAARRLRGQNPARSMPVFAIAGIARPQRFFDDLGVAGWQVAGTMAFPDHHQFSVSDMSRIFEAARRAGAGTVLTTEKDAIRMEVHAGDRSIAAVPLDITIESRFIDWLVGRASLQEASA